MVLFFGIIRWLRASFNVSQFWVSTKFATSVVTISWNSCKYDVLRNSYSLFASARGLLYTVISMLIRTDS